MMGKPNMENATAHIQEAHRLLTSEAFRPQPYNDVLLPIENFCGIVADLRRIDAQIGRKGESIFAAMAATIEAAYVEIQAALRALPNREAK